MCSDIVSRSEPGEFVVCGWFTDDAIYRPLAEQLAASLEVFGTPYYFAATQKSSGGWEANTMAKAAQVVAALDRHPGKTIVFTDVDMTARGDVSPIAQTPGDICLKVGARRRRNGSSRLTVSSQIIVAKQTPAARTFIETWARLGREQPRWGDTAETFLPLTFSHVCNCTLGVIDHVYAGKVLTHHKANKQSGRISGRLREAAHLLGY